MRDKSKTYPIARAKFFQRARGNRIANSVTLLDNFAGANFFEDLFDKNSGAT
jgi:hypothetical protein